MSRSPVRAKYTPDVLWPVFERYLSVALVRTYLASLNQRFYQRLFSPWVVIWGFIFQRLQADHSCDGFVSQMSRDTSGRWRRSDSVMGESTSAYCQARRRLPLQLAHQVLRQTAEQLQTQWQADGQWQDREVYLLDGSTLRLSASAELVGYYGCPSGGRGPSHWPVMRVLVAFHLWNGCVREVVEAPHEHSEYAMAGQLLKQLPSGIVVVMDRMFGIYRMLQVVAARGQDAVVRMQAKNVGGWTGRGTLPPNSDIDVTWSPSAADHPEMGMSIRPVAGRFLYIRLERDGFRPLPIYLFTTLTDRERYPMQAIVQLYARRWGVELDLRHVKTTLDMQDLAGKSLDIVRKELWLGLTAYNLIRALMLEAAIRAGQSPLQLSFAACWRRIRTTCAATAPALADEHTCLAHLLDRLAACRLPVRSQPRFEPRAVWGKPRVFPYIRGSRQSARTAALAPFLES